MKLDPYNNKEKYLKWRKKTKEIPEIGECNSNLILSYLNDMETGLNVSNASKKGSRSYTRLNALRARMLFLSRAFKEKFNANLTEVKEEQLHNFFSGMRNGIIRRKDGKQYQAVKDYVKDFKAFWHWHQKVNRKKGVEIQDITTDLDTSKEKPKWVYLNEEQVKRLCDNSKYEHKILFIFLFDTGIRAPTELMNVKASDFYNNFKELNIREETSKTFGRRIKLMICSELIKEYVKSKQLKPEDYLFQIKPGTLNKYLKRLAVKLFGDGVSEAGAKYSEISLYDFRHISCCYWLPRYKSESALKYRFGWKKSDKIHYYSELLGMKDTISQEDMLIDVTKTEIEKRLMQAEKRSQMLEDDNKMIHKQMSEILELIRLFQSKFEIYEQVKANRQQIEAN